MASGDKSPARTERFLDEAYGLSTLSDSLSFYGEWAGEYDEQMESRLRYIAPEQIAERVVARLTGAGGTVLDVGCGTGLVGHYLREQGEWPIDGIDVSPQMLDVARRRGVYRALFEADITQDLAIDTETYDVVSSTGTFTLGHVGAEALPELLRILRPGGSLVCTIHRDTWEANGFADAFQTLVESGDVVEVNREFGTYFSDHEATAWYCTYQKSR